MAVKNKNIKDKTGLDFNYITGRLDLVRKFNPDRIVTNERNSAGSMNCTFDPGSGQFIDLGPQIVTDNEGHVIVVGS